MSIVTASHGLARDKLLPYGRNLFVSPQPAGRKITAGFTYIQRISKAGSYDVWFPDTLRRTLGGKISQGQPLTDRDFPAEWAAVRQIELLQEAGNYKIYDLDPGDLKRATRDLSRSMRAGGYRVTVATLGEYDASSDGDELEILDRDLQERIARMIHMLYLDETSEGASAVAAAELARKQWDYRDALPHIGMVLGTQNLFCPVDKEETAEDGARRKKKGSGDTARRYRQARQFFDILNLLPQQHIVHDTAIGLQLPELNGEHEWLYVASPDETLNAFSRSLNDLFDKFNGISLSRLQGRDDAASEIKSSTRHMRSYGHPLNEQDLGFYRASAALALG